MRTGLTSANPCVSTRQEATSARVTWGINSQVIAAPVMVNCYVFFFRAVNVQRLQTQGKFRQKRKKKPYQISLPNKWQLVENFTMWYLAIKSWSTISMKGLQQLLPESFLTREKAVKMMEIESAKNVSGVTLSDRNECSDNNGGCEQICTNSVGSFTCSCREGFQQSGIYACSGIKQAIS